MSEMTIGSRVRVNSAMIVFGGQYGIVLSVDFENETAQVELEVPSHVVINFPFKMLTVIPHEERSSPYHLKPIARGIYGELSKVYEEVEELKDAEIQRNPILMLCEIADMLGAIDGYLQQHHNMTIDDAFKMTKLNRKAFESGYRS